MDRYVQSIFGSFLFLFGVLLAMEAYFAYFNMNSALIVVVTVVLLFAGIKILALSNVPLLKFLIGMSFAFGLFGHANVSGGYVSLIMAIVLLVVSLLEYRRDLSENH